MKTIKRIFKKRKREITQFFEVVLCLDIMTEDSRKDCLDRLAKAEYPKSLHGVPVPENLNLITFGDYQDLVDAVEGENDIKKMYEVARVLLNIPPAHLERCAAYDVWGLYLFVCRELNRITEIFNSINIPHTTEEQMAGVQNLQFGFFGILDWYARRMGIIDHNEVNKVPWVRIYTCLNNDTEEAKYQRRLQQVYIDRQKRK